MDKQAFQQWYQATVLNTQGQIQRIQDRAGSMTTTIATLLAIVVALSQVHPNHLVHDIPLILLGLSFIAFYISFVFGTTGFQLTSIDISGKMYELKTYTPGIIASLLSLSMPSKKNAAPKNVDILVRAGEVLYWRTLFSQWGHALFVSCFAINALKLLRPYTSLHYRLAASIILVLIFKMLLFRQKRAKQTF